MIDNFVYLAVGPGGSVWFLKNSKPPVDSGKGIKDFHTYPSLLAEACFRVVGEEGNFDLIRRCVYLRSREKIGSIQVCSPLAAVTRAELKNVGRQLAAAARWRVTASMGGWYEAGPCLAATLNVWMSLGLAPMTITQAVRKHPIWRALSFIDGINPLPLAQVLARIGDPRWQIDPSHPERLSKLYAHLNLSPASLREEDRISVRNGLFDPGQVLRSVISSIRGARPSAEESPRRFLARYREEVFTAKDDDVMADLRACQLFVKYLRSVWLEVADEVRRPAGKLFSASHFFRHEAEVLAWERHMAGK